MLLFATATAVIAVSFVVLSGGAPSSPHTCVFWFLRILSIQDVDALCAVAVVGGCTFRLAATVKAGLRVTVIITLIAIVSMLVVAGNSTSWPIMGLGPFSGPQWAWRPLSDC